MEGSTWKYVTTILILLACLSGCIWISFQQFTKFLDKVTFVGTSYKGEETPFPDFMFCSYQGFKKGSKSNGVQALPPKEYDKLTVPVDVEFVQIYDGNFSEPKKSDYKVLYQATKFNGRCKIFQLHGNMTPKVYYYFSLPMDQRFTVSVTPHDFYLFAITQDWLSSPPKMIYVDGDKQIGKLAICSRSKQILEHL